MTKDEYQSSAYIGVPPPYIFTFCLLNIYNIAWLSVHTGKVSAGWDKTGTGTGTGGVKPERGNKGKTETGTANRSKTGTVTKIHW